MIGQLFGAASSRSRQVDALVRHVAESSVEAVRLLVADRIVGMHPSEARGYVRARAGVEIRRRARQAAQQASVTDAWEHIARRASDRIAPLVLRRISMTAGRAVVAHKRAA